MLVLVLWMGAALAGMTQVDRATRGLSLHEGPWRAWTNQSRVLLELPNGQDRVLDRLLIVSALPAGMGSNPVGLDRGQLGPTRLVRLVRAADRVLVEQENAAHLTSAAEHAEHLAVTESFATSVLASLPVVAEDPERVLVDLSAFLTSDLHGVAGALARAGQGDVSRVPGRTWLQTEHTGAFRRNLAFVARATFEGGDDGREVAATTPDPRSLTVTLAQLWIELPEDGFESRTADARSGYWGVATTDHGAALSAPMYRELAARHRVSHEEPLVYYVDRGAPEPVRSALIEGAGWWTAAFDAAGLPGTFRVEVLPEDRSPYDVDVNVIQWVHRATRGWSYGDAIVDPRTGEIVKGHVTLGSQRVRYDRELFEALLGTAASGSGSPNDPEQLALARLRQLAAHEVGHTLGLRHNFAGSTDGRSSVMDYPAPRLQVKDDAIVVDDAYGVGVGAWDRAVIAWGYGSLPTRDLAALPYLTDEDTRPRGAAHPRALMWDNGVEPVAELTRILAVRRHALATFGADRVPPGAAQSDLRRVFGLAYLLHRYEVEATVRQVGGVSYTYAVGGTPDRARSVPAEAQHRALKAATDTFGALQVPSSVTELLLPAAPGHRPEALSGRTFTFDPVAAAGTGAQLVIGPLLGPARLARVHAQHRADPTQPGVDAVVNQLLRAARRIPHDAVRLEVLQAVVTSLLARASDPYTAPSVRARVDARIDTFVNSLRAAPEDRLLARTVAAYRAAQQATPYVLPEPVAPVQGPPLGARWASPCGWSAGALARAAADEPQR